MGSRRASAPPWSRRNSVIAVLQKDSNFGIERIPNGTNIFRLRVFGVNAPVYQNRLENRRHQHQ